MAWTGYQKMLALVMVITGSINSLTTKWADTMQAKGSDGRVRYFNHPFVQTAAMFIGEMLCLLTFKAIQRFSRNAEQNSLTRGNQNFNPFILMPAAMLDLVGTSIMYVGLTLTYVSSFQMFRGSVIVFVAVLSMTFLNRTVISREWLGIAFIIAGLCVVAMTDILYPSELSDDDSVGTNALITKDLLVTVANVVAAAHMLVYGLVNIIFGLVVVGLTDAEYQDETSKGTNSLITGDLLIIMAQVVTAAQMVYEEKYVAGLNIPPLQAVGWEGVFGFSVLSVLLAIFYWIPAPPHFDNNARGTVEDVVDGLAQIGNNPLILLSILGTIVSIAFFNFAGISVTKEMSATTRMVLDSVRTFVIWMASLALRWQIFHWPQLIGFGVLIYGMCEYNGLGVYDRCCARLRPGRNHDESEVVHTEADAEADNLTA